MGDSLIVWVFGEKTTRTYKPNSIARSALKSAISKGREVLSGSWDLAFYPKVPGSKKSYRVCVERAYT